MNKFVSRFWSTSSKNLSVRSRSGLEIGRLKPISGDSDDNGQYAIPSELTIIVNS